MSRVGTCVTRACSSSQRMPLTNLLIPADMVSALRIPDAAVSTGEHGGVWCDRTWGRWRWSHRYVIRLPYDPAAAARLRKHAVLTHAYAVFWPAYLLVVAWDVFRPDWGRWSFPWPLVMIAGLIALSFLSDRWNAAPIPSRTGRGDLYLPSLPPAVARLWLASNPGVRAVDRKPTYRRWPARVYVAGALLCAGIAFGLLAWLFSGADVPVELLFVAPALVAAALTQAYLALPTGNSRLNDAP